MGGYGSGRSSDRCTVESCLVLSADRLTRDKFLRPEAHKAGTLTWTRTSTSEKVATLGWKAETTTEAGRLRLHYTLTGSEEEVDYCVRLTTTPLPWGGVRWWFLCPLDGCRRRVGKLYLPPGGRYFGCRKCYELVYASSREAHKYDGLYMRIGAEIGVGPADVKRVLESMKKK